MFKPAPMTVVGYLCDAARTARPLTAHLAKVAR
jgi:hypothetical protein